MTFESRRSTVGPSCRFEMREKLERVSFTSDAAPLAETPHDGTGIRVAGCDMENARMMSGNVVKNPVISRASKDPIGYTQVHTLSRCLLAVFSRELGINSAII